MITQRLARDNGQAAEPAVMERAAESAEGMTRAAARQRLLFSCQARHHLPTAPPRSVSDDDGLISRDPTSATLVLISAGAVDRFEGLEPARRDAGPPVSAGDNWFVGTLLSSLPLTCPGQRPDADPVRQPSACDLVRFIHDAEDNLQKKAIRNQGAFHRTRACNPAEMCVYIPEN